MLWCNDWKNRVFDLWVVLFLNIPARLLLSPYRESAKSLEPQPGEMAKVFRFLNTQVLRHDIADVLKHFDFVCADQLFTSAVGPFRV